MLSKHFIIRGIRWLDYGRIYSINSLRLSDAYMRRQ